MRIRHVTPNGRAKSLVGQTFGALTVLRRQGSIWRVPAWWCRCTCGEEVLARGDKLKNGIRKSCARNGHNWFVSHAARNHVLHPAEYRIWNHMRARCRSSRQKDWRNYGGRGVKVCERWHKFENFYADMGSRPSPKHSIDRYPNQNGNYEPTNCRWATAVEQARNTRRNFYVKYRGERLLLVELMERLALSYSVVRGRLSMGWNIEDAISLPVRKRLPNGKKLKLETARVVYAPTISLNWPDDCEVK